MGTTPFEVVLGVIPAHANADVAPDELTELTTVLLLQLQPPAELKLAGGYETLPLLVSTGVGLVPGDIGCIWPAGIDTDPEGVNEGDGTEFTMVEFNDP